MESMCVCQNTAPSLRVGVIQKTVVDGRLVVERIGLAVPVTVRVAGVHTTAIASQRSSRVDTDLFNRKQF